MADVTIQNKQGDVREVDESAVRFFPGYAVVREPVKSEQPDSNKTKEK